jgi:hypothetical protein
MGCPALGARLPETNSLLKRCLRPGHGLPGDPHRRQESGHPPQDPPPPRSADSQSHFRNAPDWTGQRAARSETQQPGRAREYRAGLRPSWSPEGWLELTHGPGFPRSAPKRVPGAKSLSPEGWLEEVIPTPSLRGTRLVFSAASRARSWSPEGWLEEVMDTGSGRSQTLEGPANAATTDNGLSAMSKIQGIFVFIETERGIGFGLFLDTDHTPGGRLPALSLTRLPRFTVKKTCRFPPTRATGPGRARCRPLTAQRRGSETSEPAPPQRERPGPRGAPRSTGSPRPKSDIRRRRV